MTRRWLQRRTLRFRLATWYALGGTLLLSAFSATLYFYVAERVAQPLDRQLRRDFAEVRENLFVDENGRVLWDGHPLDQLDRETSTIPWFELWNPDGKLAGRWWQLDEDRLEQLPSSPEYERETLSIFYVAPDLRLRVLSVPVALQPDRGPWMVRVMRNHVPAADALQALLLIILVALPVVVTLLVLGGYVMTRSWLKPLDRMVEQARRITAEDLSRRLPVANPEDELGQLARVFNVTLDRLQNSFVALDRFVADASHELRTPLTTLRSVGEVGLRRSRTLPEYREIIGSMLEESKRLELLIERLLELASAGAQTVNPQPVDLDQLVNTCVAELGVLAEAKGQTLSVEHGRVTVSTDDILVRQALQNLIDNAVKYSPSNSTIRVVIRGNAIGGSISVIDEGPGIPPEHRARLTDRFYRIDAARTRSEGGFGLGLAITAAYMRALGGSLECDSVHPNGAVFRLNIPSQPTPTAS